MLHLAMIKAVKPCMFAYDRLSYAIYLPVYNKQMLNLTMEPTEVYEHLNVCTVGDVKHVWMYTC